MDGVYDLQKGFRPVWITNPKSKWLAASKREHALGRRRFDFLLNQFDPWPPTTLQFATEADAPDPPSESGAIVGWTPLWTSLQHTATARNLVDDFGTLSMTGTGTGSGAATEQLTR